MVQPTHDLSTSPFDSDFSQLYHPPAMGQRARLFAMLILLAALSLLGCKDRASAPPATRPAGVSVASLVPAATDLLVAMGASGHLVAISKWDHAQAGIEHLPRVGDYLSTDWEKIIAVRPQVMIVQIHPDKVPPGLKERAEKYNIQLANIQIERVEDVFAAIERLGQIVQEPAKAQALSAKLRGELEAVRARVAGRPPVSTLVLRDDAATAAIGRDTFLNDLLEIAGGQNVMPVGGLRYPDIDREMLVSLKPAAILQLLPDASPQQLAEAKRTWGTLAELAAARAGRVATRSEWYLLQPGSQLGTIASEFAQFLHPETAATRKVGP